VTEPPIPALALKQLQDLGITDLLVSKATAAKLIAEGLAPFKDYQLYQQFKISHTDSPDSNIGTPTLIGYWGDSRESSFKWLQFYFFINPELYNLFELIELKKDLPIPPNVAIVITNEEQATMEIPVVILPPDSNGLPTYSQFAAKLKQGGFNDTLLGMRQGDGAKVNEPANLNWDSTTQAFRLAELTDNQLVRLNYSYTPQLSSNDGYLYRGLAERLYFLPRKESAIIEYRRTNSTVVVAYFLSSLSFLLTIAAIRRRQFCETK
jgi:hypothetical protein